MVPASIPITSTGRVITGIHEEENKDSNLMGRSLNPVERGKGEPNWKEQKENPYLPESGTAVLSES